MIRHEINRHKKLARNKKGRENYEKYFNMLHCNIAKGAKALIKYTIGRKIIPFYQSTYKKTLHKKESLLMRILNKIVSFITFNKFSLS